ncbi:MULTISPECIES: STAS/SEC14 domain-containing protein [unclassified Microbulbifer]|uniref:STAS/SEC14 domain-containing protein n=1 Tax=unclassified Microbulbifer TaxID=2619833 RepID=UPI0027E4D546|nr:MULTISPECIES: STAS/SEC14 domain-containing protein [unclassified Microbulbifer]
MKVSVESIVSHGICVGIGRVVGSDFFLYLKAAGRLDHVDYEMAAPLIDGALQAVAHPRVKVLFDVTDFQGWEPCFAWDDFTLVLRHHNKFSRIAILGRSNWPQVASGIAAWFMSGEANYFEDREAALEWLA